MAYAAGTRARSYRFYRELVRTWTAKRTSARRKLSALELFHSPAGRVVCGSFDLACSETPRGLHRQLGFRPLADTRRLLQRFRTSCRISYYRCPADRWPDAPLSAFFGGNANSALTDITRKTAFELVVWLGMSATAGFSEELVFRGYLTRQFRTWTGSLVFAVIPWNAGARAARRHRWRGSVPLVKRMSVCLNFILHH